MIGLLLGGFGGNDNCLFGIIAAIIALCAIFGLYQCCTCRLRNCRCCKKLLLATGTDTYKEFRVTILVHEAMFTVSKGKASTFVRVTAGDERVETDENNKGVYQQALDLFVEQGTESIEIELLDSSKNLFAVLSLDPEKDILKAKEPCMEKIFNMKEKNKGVLNPRIKLTMQLELDADLEKSLFADFDTSQMSDKTELMLRTQLNKIKDEDADADGDGQTSSLELLVMACAGPLEKFGSWGAKELIYVAIRGPPESRKYSLSLYANEKDHANGKKPFDQIEILKILSVQPDPDRPEVFIIHFVGKDKVKQRTTFQRTDRGRDVWVEMLVMLVNAIREDKDARKHKPKR